MKKIHFKMLSFFLSILMCMTFILPSYAQDIDELDLVAETAIAMEASTGEVLYSKNANKKMYPASTTKLWTAYLVIKNIEDLDTVITVEEDLSWVEPSSMFLKVGESFTVKELLQVMMLKSANDVAVLLATEVSGSVEEFAELMNREAKYLGCTSTNFINPNGLPDENHYSTAYDMALIARECVRNDVLMEIVSTEKISLPSNEFYPYGRSYTNSNKFITGKGQMPYNDELVDFKYDIVDGLKTGYTSVAGRCLLATAKVGETRVITGVFNSKKDNVYVDSRKLIDYSLENYKATTVIDAKTVEPELEKKVLFSKEKVLKGYLKEGYSILEKITDVSAKSKDDFSNYSYEVKLDKKTSIPVDKHDEIGSVDIYNGDEQVDSLIIYAKNDITPILDMEQIILLTLGIGLIVTISIRKIKRKKIQHNSRMQRNIYINARSRRY